MDLVAVFGKAGSERNKKKGEEEIAVKKPFFGPLRQIGDRRRPSQIAVAAERKALSLFRSNVCWAVLGEKRAMAFSVLVIIESKAFLAASKSSRVQRPLWSCPLFINSDAMRSALRFACSILCCHFPGSTFFRAFADLLISEARGGSRHFAASVVDTSIRSDLCWGSDNMTRLTSVGIQLSTRHAYTTAAMGY